MTTSAAAPDVRLVDGRLCLVVDAQQAGRLAALLDQAIATRHRLGLPLSPDVQAIHAAARAAHAFASLGVVPVSVPNLDSASRAGGPWISTGDAAAVLGVTQRAVLKRVATGRLAGQKTGGRWLVHIERRERA